MEVELGQRSMMGLELHRGVRKTTVYIGNQTVDVWNSNRFTVFTHGCYICTTSSS